MHHPPGNHPTHHSLAGQWSVLLLAITMVLAARFLQRVNPLSGGLPTDDRPHADAALDASLSDARESGLDRDAIRLELPGGSGPLPELCFSKRWLKRDCPGCGLTRSVVTVSRGEWRRALHIHPAGPLVFVLALLQIPYRLGNIWRIRSGRLPWRTPGTNAMLACLGAICLVQWMLRIPV